MAYINALSYSVDFGLCNNLSMPGIIGVQSTYPVSWWLDLGNLLDYSNDFFRKIPAK